MPSLPEAAPAVDRLKVTQFGHLRDVVQTDVLLFAPEGGESRTWLERIELHHERFPGEAGLTVQLSWMEADHARAVSVALRQATAGSAD
jgi:hypothetical protein